jgi:hypothetical protein
MSTRFRTGGSPTQPSSRAGKPGLAGAGSGRDCPARHASSTPTTPQTSPARSGQRAPTKDADMSTGPIAPLAPARAAVPVPPFAHGHNPDRWPLCDTITLGALDGAVPSARAHLRQILLEWGHPELADDASVVISELVTNAVVASASLRPAIAPVQIWLGLRHQLRPARRR